MSGALGIRLVERETELEELRELLAGARAGRGAVAVVEAPAGQGKTALLRALRDEAAASGVEVLSATGAALERTFAFGVVRQLFEGELHRSDRERRARLLEGAAALAEPVFGSGAAKVPAGDDASHATLHGLYWLCANLAAEGPLLLVVDDAHWADAPSLRFLDALARRVEDLPVLVAVGARPGEPEAEQDILDALILGAAAHLIRPGALTPAGVGQLVRAGLGSDVEEPFLAACFETTRGTPLLVRELVRTLREERFGGTAAEADAVRQAVPSTVTRTVAARLRGLSPAALAVARALAILGDGSTPAAVIALARVEPAAAAEAHRTLTAIDLIDPDEPRFVHPMVHEAVAAGMSLGERSVLHRRAARILDAAGAHAGAVATHLLAAVPSRDPWAAGILARAGRRALAEGAPDVALRILRRALEEGPDEDDRPGLLLAAGLAATRAGEPEALERLQAAADTGDLRVVPAAARAMASVLVVRDRADLAADHLRSAMEVVRTSPDLAADLEDQLVEVLAYTDDGVPEYRRRVEAAASSDRLTILCHLASARAMAGAPAAEVVPLALRGLADGLLARRLGVERYTALWGMNSLLAVEAADAAAAARQQVAEVVRRSGSRPAAAPVAWTEARWHRRFGDLRRAEDAARLAREIAGGAAFDSMANTVTLAGVLADRGDLPAAREVAAELPEDGRAASIVGLHALRGRLLAEEGRHAEALAQLDRQHAADDARNWKVSTREDSRVLRATLLAALGRGEEARAVADHEVAFAQARGAAGAEAIARLARAGLLAGDEALDELRAAVAAARRSPFTVTRAQTLARLGAALRRAGRRTDARPVLREARDLAHRYGATGLEEEVHQELVVAGARPQRVAFSGADALTASERRVAELAASGLRNREIAEALYVTLKTVELHLGRAYAKLGIKGRSQLPGALAGG